MTLQDLMLVGAGLTCGVICTIVVLGVLLVKNNPFH